MTRKLALEKHQICFLTIVEVVSWELFVRNDSKHNLSVLLSSKKILKTSKLTGFVKDNTGFFWGE